MTDSTDTQAVTDAPALDDKATPVTQEAKPTMAEGQVEDKQATAPSDFPTDWREKLSGGDEKIKAMLDRYASPADLAKAQREAQQKLSSGQHKTPLPKDPTPEQLAQYRKDNGIPESYDKYEIKLEGGIVPGENDKPRVDAFLKEMHEANASPQTVNAALNAYYKLTQQEEIQRAENDSNFRTQSEDALRAEWGGDFRKNVNMVASLLNGAPEGVGDLLRGGRTAEGNLLGDDPGVMRWLANLAREINPTATITPSDSHTGPNAIGDEIASIEKLMGDRSSDYWRGPKAPGGNETQLQVRYRELLTAKMKLDARK